MRPPSQALPLEWGASVAACAIHEIDEWLTCLAALDVFGDDFACGCGAGFGGDVRGDRDLGMRPEGMICRQGLDAEDIERGMRDLAAGRREDGRSFRRNDIGSSMV